MKALGVSEADFYAGEGGRRMEIEACGGIQGYKRGSTMQTQVNQNQNQFYFRTDVETEKHVKSSQVISIHLGDECCKKSSSCAQTCLPTGTNNFLPWTLNPQL
jgi:hypothetical protein